MSSAIAMLAVFSLAAMGATTVAAAEELSSAPVPPGAQTQPESPEAPQPEPTPEPPAPQPSEPEPPAVTPEPEAPVAPAPEQEPVAPPPAAPEPQEQTPADAGETESAPEPPYLRWRATDAASASVAGATFDLQGPRNDGATDDGEDGQWLDALGMAVADNTGEAGYAGADLDPAPGVFLVKQLVDAEDPAATHDVAAGETYRVRVAKVPSGFTADGAEWQQVAASGSAEDPVQAVVLAAAKPKTKETQVTPFAAQNQATITVNAAAIRGSSTGLNGITYTLHDVLGNGTNGNPYRAGTASPFSCTVAAGASSCVITVTGVNNQGGNNKNWFLVQSANGSSYTNDQYRLNDYTTPQDVFHYVGRTVSLASTRDYVIPGSGNNRGLDQTSGNYSRADSLAVPLNNPAIQPTCTPGLKVAIQMDISSSTANYRTGYRNSLNSMIDSLVGTGTRVSLFTFGNTSPVRVGGSDWESPTPRNVDTDAAAIKSSITTYTGNPGTQRTNWDAGYRRLASANQIHDYDLVLFITDGAPNVVWASNSSGYDSPNGNNVTVRSIDEAVLSANALKNAGVRIATVGVGPGVQGDVYRNLRVISGPTAGSDYYVGQWDELEGYIKNIIDAANCNLPVTVSKTTVAENGTVTNNVPDWTFGAQKSAGSAAAVTLTGSSPQTTGSGVNGRALWNLKFTSSSNQSAGVALTENAPPAGWTLTGAECTVNGAPATNAVFDAASRTVTVPGLTAGSGAVHCTFTNTEAPPTAELTLVKKVENAHGGTSQVSDWTLTATGATTGVTGKTGEAAVTNRVVTPGDYTLSESGALSAGYTAGAWECKNGSTPLTVTAAKVAIPKGGKITCTITNTDKPGEVTWTKVSPDEEPLAGSEWKLTGPGAPAPAGVTVVDCTAATCPTGAFRDQDPAAGEFKLTGLSWGDYTLVETKAPPGHVLDTTEHPFTVGIGSGKSLTVDLGAFENVPAEGPEIPLTGGIGRDQILLAGGGALAIAALAAGALWLRKRRISEVG
ncbi:VWA domain-containing protein [Leucobacter sp. CSA1]|uniref:VWA domain-containing protein n=1 Tax=Leucobacter chromiisoli TaxID=2796471 RepID=A0A934Q6T8_9MICO|nr:SpaA isopeptide-forming pilin-related protein [Leucobacter chromiisoli]MBK0417744.1 VWA domain-containing protein [Leucobacter chromiisoli]